MREVFAGVAGPGLSGRPRAGGSCGGCGRRQAGGWRGGVGVDVAWIARRRAAPVQDRNVRSLVQAEEAEW